MSLLDQVLDFILLGSRERRRGRIKRELEVLLRLRDPLEKLTVLTELASRADGSEGQALTTFTTKILFELRALEESWDERNIRSRWVHRRWAVLRRQPGWDELRDLNRIRETPVTFADLNRVALTLVGPLKDFKQLLERKT